jgi:arsenate reductase
MTITIYHNPRCSKSRKTLAIIEEAGIEPQVSRYLDEPPAAAEILTLSRQLGRPVRDLLRRGETVFKEAIDLPDLDDDGALAAWLETHPIVLERPIVVDSASDRAIIGRPPEQVRELLG